MHIIRLRHPWTRLDADVSPEPGGSEPEELVFQRKFHKPTGVTSQRVTLCIKPLISAAITADLNATCLESHTAEQSILCDVSAGLQPFNTLQVRVSANEPTSLPAGSATPTNREVDFAEIAEVELQIH